MRKQTRWQFWIDVGGTFTDCVALSPTGEIRTHKTLSSGRIHGEISHSSASSISDERRCTEPENFWTGWECVIWGKQGDVIFASRVQSSTAAGDLVLRDAAPAEVVSGLKYQLHSHLEAPVICIRAVLGLSLSSDLPAVDVRLGTTRGTNALLERKGARTAFIVTKGFADLLLIGNQDRPDLFDLNIKKPVPLYHSVLEVDERLAADGTVLQPLQIEALRRDLERLHAAGIESIGITLLHAYRNASHEELVERIARKIGFTEVSRSSVVAPTIKIVPRAETTVLDAYLTPVLRTYVTRIRAELSPKSTLKLMTSHGGLVDGRLFTGKDAILSGPAGGVVAFAKVGQMAGWPRTIGFDMGGTSTDVSRFGGEFEIQSETTKANVRLASPTLAIETVAAGGGSICDFDGVQLRVGPESAGADPGPACYGRGGPFTITDANVALGRVLPEQFPFPLDKFAVAQRLSELCLYIEAATGQQYTPQDLAQGFVDIANEIMARAIRKVSIQKGYNPREHALVSFGGAGGQHACAMARSLGIDTILVHPFAGILSAYGMGLAEIRKREELTLLELLKEISREHLASQFQLLETRLEDAFRKEGLDFEQLQSIRRSLSLRYAGLDSTLVITDPPNEDYAAAYTAEHFRLFGYQQVDRDIEVVTVQIEGVSPGSQIPFTYTQMRQPTSESFISTSKIGHAGQQLTVPVWQRRDLTAGGHIPGPALVCDLGSTIWLEPGFHCDVQTDGVLLIQRDQAIESTSITQAVSEGPDLILLEVFNNRFASIAEQMGVTLQKTAVSTNVKERLDYSCAIFDSRGGLVVNAPHIPVHLGAMGETVQEVLRACPEMKRGDVYITNDPYGGGSHLPDVTIVTPVHHSKTGALLFLTASRAHHAEIGGIRPGSMPPFSKNLAEEGVLIRLMKLVDEGVSREAELCELFTAGEFPSRNVRDNLADVAAQVAANQIGGRLLSDLIREQGEELVARYMTEIQETARVKMERALRQIPDGRYPFQDALDDGSPVCVEITIHQGRAKIDFTGTGPVLSSNLNANRAIVSAACMYVFRCLIAEPIPLNCGVLQPLEISLPESLLNPPRFVDSRQCAAMVGGNVETSQRVVDVLLGALGVAAASQGTMNNLTFGNKTFGYYETICGGAGATPTQAGADAVHTHMTNTRLTDVEVIEHRYPVRIREFKIRRNSGGQGLHSGGAGITRHFEFLAPLKVSLLTQRRGEFAPFGLSGGESGQIGRNSFRSRGNEAFMKLEGAVQLEVDVGDQLLIETPGGGGFGAVEFTAQTKTPQE